MDMLEWTKLLSTMNPPSCHPFPATLNQVFLERGLLYFIPAEAAHETHKDTGTTSLSWYDC
jgi:hypothetical protein